MRSHRTPASLALIAATVLVCRGLCQGTTPPPLTPAGVMGLLAGGAPADDVALRVERDGIAFRDTPEFEEKLAGIERRNDPGDAHLANALGFAAVAAAASAGAERQIEAALVRGAGLLRMDNPPTAKEWAAAAAAFEEAARLDPKDAAVQFALATALEGEGDIGAATAALREVLKMMPDLAAAHVRLGQCLARGGDVEAGVAELRQGVKVAPQSDYARLALVRALMEGRDWAGAAEMLRAGIQVHPNNPLLHNSLGVALLDTGQTAAAIQELQRAVALGSKDPRLHVDLGAALERAGYAQEGIAQLRIAIRMEPDLAQARYMLAEALINSGQPSPAMAELNQLIQLRPDFAAAYSERGYLLVQQGQVKQAMEQYRQAIQIDPNFATAHANLGTAYWREHDNPDGYREMLTAHELAPNDAAITRQFDKLPEDWKRRLNQPGSIEAPPGGPMGEPAAADYIYYADAGTKALVPLEEEMPVFAAKQGMFNLNYQVGVVGEGSPVKLAAAGKWEFLIRRLRAGEPVRVRLQRFAAKGGQRVVKLESKLRITRDSRRPGLLSFNVSPFGKSSLALTIPYALAPGEYGFSLTADGSLAMFCFEVER